MLYRRLDENWDYCFGRGRQNYISGLDAVVQAIKTRLQLLKEEWWEDQNDKMPETTQYIEEARRTMKCS